MPSPFDMRLASLISNGTAIGGGNMDASSQDWQSALNWVKQYDPNASLQWMGESGGQYLNFNNSLLPQNVLGGHGIERIARGTPGSGERLAVPGAVVDDPIYGRVTTPQNLQEKGTSMVDIIGPLMVAAATMGGGLAGLAPGMAAAGFDAAGSGAFAAGGSGTFGAGAGAFSGSAGNLLQRAMSQGPRALSGMGQKPTLTPQQMMLLRLLAMRGRGG